MDKNSSKKTGAIATLIFLIVTTLVLFVSANSYTFFINSEEGIVAQRYVESLVVGTNEDDLDTHIDRTELISYDIENLTWVFDSAMRSEIKENPSMRISENRFTDEEGITFLYIYLDEYEFCYDIGLKKQGYFWDVYSINIVDDSKLGYVLSADRFLPLR